MTRKKTAIGLIVLGGIILAALLVYQFMQRSVLMQLTNGRLEEADYWRDEPVILAAGMGFDNIIGLPDMTEATVRQAGGSWYGGLQCTNGKTPSSNLLTSAAVADTIGLAYKGYADYDDGLPIEFSWPVATETVDPTDFQFTLSTGEIVFGHAAGMIPIGRPTSAIPLSCLAILATVRKAASLARSSRSSWRSLPMRHHSC